MYRYTYSAYTYILYSNTCTHIAIILLLCYIYPMHILLLSYNTIHLQPS